MLFAKKITKKGGGGCPTETQNETLSPGGVSTAVGRVGEKTISLFFSLLSTCFTFFLLISFVIKEAALADNWFPLNKKP